MKLKAAFIQYDIVWEDIKSNIFCLTKIIDEIVEQVDLIVLPEMFSTGFSMITSKISQGMDGEVIKWMTDVAKLRDSAVMGTICVRVNNDFYNRAVFVTPNCEVQFYDKRHLFRMGGEYNYYTSGCERKVFVHKGVRIMPQICYDLRFPVWSRNRNDYDVLIYMANWPSARGNVWDILLKSRAIENQSYVLGVNRVGSGGGIEYAGNSMFIDYLGNSIINLGDEINRIKILEIDTEPLFLFREKFPAYLDADKFEVVANVIK